MNSKKGVCVTGEKNCDYNHQWRDLHHTGLDFKTLIYRRVSNRWFLDYNVYNWGTKKNGFFGSGIKRAHLQKQKDFKTQHY